MHTYSHRLGFCYRSWCEDCASMKGRKSEKNVQLIRNTAQESSANFLVLSIFYWIFSIKLFHIYIMWVVSVMNFLNVMPFLPACVVGLTCPCVLVGAQRPTGHGSWVTSALEDPQRCPVEMAEHLRWAADLCHPETTPEYSHPEPPLRAWRQTQDIHLLMCE